MTTAMTVLRDAHFTREKCPNGSRLMSLHLKSLSVRNTSQAPEEHNSMSKETRSPVSPHTHTPLQFRSKRVRKFTRQIAQVRRR